AGCSAPPTCSTTWPDSPRPVRCAEDRAAPTGPAVSCDFPSTGPPWVRHGGQGDRMQALTSSGAVVVGFDRSERSSRAVRWAAAEAASQHRPLLLVHVLNWPADHHPKALLPGEETLLGPLQRMLQRELDELTADCRSEVDLEVRSALPLGDPAE